VLAVSAVSPDPGILSDSSESSISSVFLAVFRSRMPFYGKRRALTV